MRPNFVFNISKTGVLILGLDQRLFQGTKLLTYTMSDTIYSYTQGVNLTTIYLLLHAYSINKHCTCKITTSVDDPHSRPALKPAHDTLTGDATKYGNSACMGMQAQVSVGIQMVWE
jgi:hypothetical protein